MDGPTRFSRSILMLLVVDVGFAFGLGLTNSTPSHEHRLIKRLFKFYNPSVRPRYDSSTSVEVRVRFSLQQINDLDEKRQILKMSGWLTAEWTDDFLTWNPADYGGMEKIVVEPSKLWIPKLAIGNSANRLFDGEHYKRFWITVRYSGDARWQPGGVFAIACALDMNFYPFDDQNCTMEIETWVYTADKVNLSHSLDRIGLDTYIPHGEWTIIKTSVYSINKIYPYYLTESFPEVYCTIYVRRKYTFYFMYILLPCLMLSGVLLMIFVIPADSGEKVSLGVSILLAISVFLLLVAGKVPDTSDSIPIIAIYLTYFMLATTLSVAFSVMVVKVHFKSPEHRPPQWLRHLVYNCLAKAVGITVHKGILKAHLKSRVQRDATWSDTATEDLRSQNSRATLTPDASQENYELMVHSRRKIVNDDSNYDVTSATSIGTRTLAQEVHSLGHLPLNYNEWKQIAEVLDRFFFYLFLFFLIVPTIAILGIVRLFKPEL